MPHCGFCGNTQKTVGTLVEGTGVEDETVYICSQCIDNCKSVIDAQALENRSNSLKLLSVPTPFELFEHLNQYVIGQRDAKKRLAVEVSSHYQRIIDSCEVQNIKFGDETFIKNEELMDVEIEKSNILLIGPTGSGKTLLAKSLAHKLDVPFAIGDATSLTEAGYVGEDVENLLLKLLASADYDVDRAQNGIIYIDEIDKTRSTGGNVSITRDVGGQGVQQSLLKMIEGTVCSVPPQGGRKHPEQQLIQIDTSQILFILGGAFVGIEDIVRRRLNKKQLGFGRSFSSSDEIQERNSLLKEIRQDDLIEYGMIPELIGRLPVIAPLEELSLDDLIKVLVEPKNALIKQERKKLLYQGVNLEFTNDALRKIAEIAIEKEIGARALRSVVSGFMTDIIFDLPVDAKGKSFLVDADVVTGKKKLFSEKLAA